MADIKQTGVTHLKKGSYVIFDNMACKVLDIQTSRPGKHGHAKCRITAEDLIDGKKVIKVMPGHDNVDVPIIEKKTAQILSVNDDTANVMDMETYETFDMHIPSDLKDEVAEGKEVFYWEILDRKVIKQIK